MFVCLFVWFCVCVLFFFFFGDLDIQCPIYWALTRNKGTEALFEAPILSRVAFFHCRKNDFIVVKR